MGGLTNLRAVDKKIGKFFIHFYKNLNLTKFFLNFSHIQNFKYKFETNLKPLTNSKTFKSKVESIKFIIDS